MNGSSDRMRARVRALWDRRPAAHWGARDGSAARSGGRRATAKSLGRIAVAALLFAGAGLAQAVQFEDFTGGTWARWQKELPRPAVVVFTTTYCPTCPEVIAGLASSIKEAGSRAPLITVIMDPDGLHGGSAHHAHFDLAQRLFVFRGQEPALRYSVDPKWRGVTPYVALFGAQGAPTFSAGAPPAERLNAVLGK